jgi:hypothetical protein
MSRRRFGLAAVALGAVLSAAGAALADASGVAAAVGLAALAQGIGLLVAGAWLALGHNPLNRERRWTKHEAVRHRGLGRPSARRRQRVDQLPPQGGLALAPGQFGEAHGRGQQTTEQSSWRYSKA